MENENNKILEENKDRIIELTKNERIDLKQKDDTPIIYRCNDVDVNIEYRLPTDKENGYYLLERLRHLYFQCKLINKIQYKTIKGMIFSKGKQDAINFIEKYIPDIKNEYNKFCCTKRTYFIITKQFSPVNYYSIDIGVNGGNNDKSNIR